MIGKRQKVYDVVVYGYEFATAIMLQFVHERYKAKLQPTWDFLFVIAGVVLATSTTGIRVRLMPKVSDDDIAREDIEETAIARYEKNLILTNIIAGLVVAGWSALRSILWSNEIKEYKNNVAVRSVSLDEED